jgi:hypothetical protein
LLLGQYLVDQILTNGHELGLQLAFVWNRTKTNQLNSIVDNSLILDDLKDFVKYEVDLIVEVSHPIITRQFGAEFLKHSDFMVVLNLFLTFYLKANIFLIESNQNLFDRSGLRQRWPIKTWKNHLYRRQKNLVYLYQVVLYGADLT